MTYEIDIAGLKRNLPLCKVSDDLYIGAFVMFGDVEMTVHCAAELLKRAPEYDYIIAPEAKSIPLLYEMARQSGADKYFLARKGPKAYMSGVFEVNVKSITTMGVQKLVIDSADAELIKGKRMLIIDETSFLPARLSAPWKSWSVRRAASSPARWRCWRKVQLLSAMTSSFWRTSLSLTPTEPSRHKKSSFRSFFYASSSRRFRKKR